MDPNEKATTPDDDTQIEPSADMLSEPNADVLAAVEASLSGEPAPEPAAAADAAAGDDKPTGDEAGDGATHADDKAVEPPAAPADKPVADDKPAVDGEPTKRPSDEFGELPKDVKAETRERFETMRTKYDELSTERDEYKAQATKWVETVQSTGADPEQFGMTLQYLKAVNSGTPEGLQAAFDMMQGELAVLAKALGKEVDGINDPLAEYPDLQQRIEDANLDRADALEIAAARNMSKLRTASEENAKTQNTQHAAVNSGLGAVKAFGQSMRATDPAYDAKTAAIKPMVERVVANLPPEQWAAAVKELYDGVSHITAAPVAQAPPTPTVDQKPLRPSSTPAGGGGMDKKPGSAYEAMELALSQ